MSNRGLPEGSAPILVVAAFDRFDAELLPWDTAPRVGSIRRMALPRVNPFDAVAVTGRAITGAGWYFDAVSDEAFDDLEPPVARRHPEVSAAVASLRDAGALGAIMSGSGPTVFAVARDAEHAAEVRSALGGTAPTVVASVGSDRGAWDNPG